MSFFKPLRFAGAVLPLVVLVACSSSSDSTPPPPAPETLFDNLPAASPSKLRGVWSQGGEQKQAAGTIEMRYRFLDNTVVGAVKCVFGGGAPIIGGNSIPLDTTALDAGEGKLSMGALVVEKKTEQALCRGGNPNSGTFDFKITDNTLTLTVPGTVGKIELIKVGD